MAKKVRKRALVLGIGNILLGDEGLGVRAVELFEKEHMLPDEVVCLDGGTTGLGLLSIIKDYSHVIIVDAVASGSRPPGTIIRIPESELEEFPSLKSASAHQLGVRDLLTLARFEGNGPEAVVIGMVPADVTAGTDLTPKIRKRLPALSEMIREELADKGFRVRKRG